MRSSLIPDLTTEIGGFVFLMNNKTKEHAFLIVEYTGGIFKADFRCPSFADISKDSGSQYVAGGYADIQAECSSGAASLGLKARKGEVALNELTDVDVFSEKVKDYDFKCYPVEHEKCQKLIGKVKEQKVNPPDYKVSGGRAFFDRESNTFNCITWAEHMLAEMEVKIEIPYIAGIWDSFVAKPSKHFKQA